MDSDQQIDKESLIAFLKECYVLDGIDFENNLDKTIWDIGLDSLDALELSCDLEDFLDISISDDSLDKTVDKLLDHILEEYNVRNTN